MSKKPFFFEAKSEEEANLHIYGEIGWDESYFGDGTNNVAYALVSLIKRLDKKYKRINVHINSPGGYIEDGLAIYNTLKSANADIHTYNDGLVASMASIIMLAGTTHFPKTSIYHLHSASTVTIGNIKEHEQSIDTLRTFEETLKNAIKAKTNLSDEEINNWFDGKEHYMTAEQANEFGFVDVLEDSTAEPPAAKNKLEKMDFKQILELYKNEQNATKTGILNKILNRFSNNNSNHEKKDDMSKLVFKAKLTVLLALLNLQEFVLNENNKVELDINDMFKINDDIQSKNDEIEALKQDNLAKEESISNLKAEIDDLKEKLSGKPADNAANPKAADNTKDEPEEIVIIDRELSEKLHAFNRAEGWY